MTEPTRRVCIMEQAEIELRRTKGQMLSAASVNAWMAAEYCLCHNRRYESWSQARRFAYCMERAFNAAAQEKTT